MNQIRFRALVPNSYIGTYTYLVPRYMWDFAHLASLTWKLPPTTVGGQFGDI